LDLWEGGGGPNADVYFEPGSTVGAMTEIAYVGQQQLEQAPHPYEACRNAAFERHFRKNTDELSDDGGVLCIRTTDDQLSMLLLRRENTPDNPSVDFAVTTWTEFD
jgi:hypothetical protein